MSDDFYASLAPVEDFEGLSRPESYAPLPSDWAVVTADVANSTAAIREGRYKEVNTVGVSVIAAVRNAVRPVEVPYLFGGDGALVLVPERFEDRVRAALAATVAMAREAFGLELRAAFVPSAWVAGRGHELLVARHRVSEHYEQSAVFQSALFGSGAVQVERALKRGELPPEYRVEADPEASADYGGLECRWNEVPSPGEETVALIVQATGPTEGGAPGAPGAPPGGLATGSAAGSAAPLTTYRRVMALVRDTYGGPEACRPVREEGLSVAFSGRVLGNELRLRFWRSGPLRRLQEAVRLRVTVAVGALLLRLGVRTRDTNWGRYKADLVANTDFRKFDGTLRLVVAGDAEQRARLTAELDRLQARGELTYGIHVARSAIMTCLVERREGAHLHFVDAAGGGYAAAAARMKGGEG